MASTTLNPVTYGNVSFTNITISETFTGSVEPIVSGNMQDGAGLNSVGITLNLGAFSGGVYYANSIDVINLNYTVSSTSPNTLLDSMFQAYTAETPTGGPGIHLTAVETVTDMAGHVIAIENYVFGASNLPVTFSHAEQSVNVALTVTLSVDPTGNSDSALVISSLQQAFGTITVLGMAVPTGISSVSTTATIGNTVWVDANGDGLLDNGEAGASDVTVELLSTTGSVVATTRTDVNGNYRFTAAAGTYEVQVLAPAGDSFASANAVGTAGEVNSAVNGAGVTPLFVITGGQNYTGANAGLVPPTGSIGSTVWLDANRDGVLDNAETGVGGVTVELLSGSGAVLNTTTTDAAGHYAFNGLVAGNYEVQVIAPDGDGYTTQNAAAAGIVSNVNASGLSSTVTLPAGGVGVVNAGLVQPIGSIGSTVWLDANRDGVLDNNEAGIGGVTVELLNESGSVILQTTTTDAFGHYAFNQLTAGSYEVQVIAPAGDAYTTQNAAAAGIVSNVNGSGLSSVVTLAPGGVGVVNAGLVLPNGLIGSTVWLDANRDGVLDNAETGVAGVTVELLSGSGVVLNTTTTDALGHYAFNGLAAGSYQVQVIAPVGDAYTTQDAATSGIVSNVNASGLSSMVTLPPGGVGVVNAGLVLPTGSIGSTVWLDANRDGVLDNAETGVAGVTVELLNDLGAVLKTTTTDAAGHYAFNGLAAGSYGVHVIAPVGDGYTTQNAAATGVVSNVNALGVSSTVTLAAGGVGVVNAGLVLGSIGSTVWLDTNHDGLLDTNEAGVANVTVELLNAAGGVLNTTTTDATGHYAFNGLTAGTYEVAFVAPAGDGFTTQNAGPNPAVASSANAVTGVTAPVTLAAGAVNNTVNAGLTKAALGDYVWLDLNRNGLQDGGEAGVAGVGVQLLAADTLTLKLSEDAYQGNAQYTVSVNGVQIGGTRTATALHASGADNIVTLTGDFGSNPTVVVTFLNDLYAGTATTDRNLYVDGITYNGVVQSASAALLSAGPRSFALTGAGEVVLATTTTNSAGYYGFNNLNAGVYEVKFVAPSGDAFTVQNAGTNTAINSNANQTTGISAPVTLTAGQVDNTIDAGLVMASGITVLKQPCSVVVNQCGQVTYSFLVTNTGLTPLTNVRITDNIGTAANPDNITPTAVLACNGFNVGDSNHNGILDAGETWQYTETISQITCTPGAAGSVCHGTSGSNLSAGCTAWLHTSFNPTSCADGATYKFQGVTCTISGSGVGTKPISLRCPDAQVTFSRSCTQASTVFNASTNCWVTTLPANCSSGAVFLSGCPLTIPSGCNLSNTTVTWSIGDSANNCGARSLVWDGGCTGYQTFNQNGLNGTANYNQIGIKSCDNASGYGNGGSCSVGYGYNGASYCDTGYNSNGGGSGGSGCGSMWNTHAWLGCGSDAAGMPQNFYVSNNCGDTSSCAGVNLSGGLSSLLNVLGLGCGTGSSGGSSCGGSGSATQATSTIAGAADTVTVSAQTVTGMSCATTTASGSHLTSGCTAWLHSTFKPTSCADGASYSFKNVSCTISGSGSAATTLSCPNATVTFSKACSAATTTYNAATNCWVTTLPADCSPGNVFLSGCPQTIASGCDLTNAKVTWSIGSSTNTCGASNLSWDGNCIGFGSFSQNSCSDYNQIGVKACDTQGVSGLCAGTPVNQYSSSNCGNTAAYTTPDTATNTCGTTCTVTSTGATVTATDTKEVQVLGCNSPVSVNGTATTASLSATYGSAQTLEFIYAPGNVVALKQVQAGLAAVSGSNSAGLAFMEISNNANPFAAGASIYFSGVVTSGEKIFADATTNVLTNTPIGGGHFSTTAGANIYAYVFTSQQAFQGGAAPVQTMAYNASGSQAMHIGDTLGSLTLLGYVGANGGHLVS